MSTKTSMPARTAAADDSRPQVYARVIGALFVVLFVLGPIAILYLPGQLVVADDPAATAANISADEGLFRLTIVLDTVILLVEAVMAALLYALFRSVSRPLAALTALARLAQAAVMGANLLLYFLALLLAGGTVGYVGALEQSQRDTLTLLFLDTHGYGVLVGQAFFGLSLLALAFLARGSGFVPRILGTLMFVAAAGYLIDSFAAFVDPAFAEPMAVIVGVTALLGEVPLFLWLLVKGVTTTAVDPYRSAGVREEGA